MDTPHEIDGLELWRRRKALGISQRVLAESLGTSSANIGRWERGVMPIRFPVMLGLAMEAIEAKRSQRRQVA